MIISMIISLHIIIIAAVLLVLALVTPLFSPFFRKVYEEEGAVNGEEGTSALPPVSIVLTDHDSSYHLKKVLPQLLAQQYPADYQVIVVIDRSDSESENVLKLHASDPHLYYTMLPDTSRYLSRKKLGITLGIRAAKHDWVLVTDVHSIPSSEHWLESMARHCADNVNMVLGMSLYGEDAPSYFRYDQVRNMLYFLRMAQKGMPFSSNQSVVMLRKSEFFAASGFRGNLEYTRAEFEFLVNKFAREGACALAIEPQAWMNAIKPSAKRWRMRQLFAIDAMSGMERTAGYRFLRNWDLCTMHLYNLLTLLAIIYSLLLLPALDGIVLLAASVLFWVVSNVERAFIYRPMLRYFDCISPLAAVAQDWTLSCRNIVMRLRYAFADKNDFITHKL